MKKAQSISLNTIIVAAIALMVLVIVAIIFMARMGWFTHNSNNCRQYNGNCDMGLRCEEGYRQHPVGICYDGSEVDRSNICCVRDIAT